MTDKFGSIIAVIRLIHLSGSENTTAMKAPYIALYLALLLFFPTILFSQQAPEQMPGISDRADYEKLYLHTDRDYYFLGDTIWFKAYCLDGRTHRFPQGIFNLHAELIDRNGIKIQNQLLYVEEGRAPGRMSIPDTLDPGQYLLRAYTDEQVNLGEDHFFQKTLEVSKLRSTLDKEDTIRSEAAEPQIDLAFLPEGGFLLAGRMNTAGIKTVNEQGRSIAVIGEILNQEGVVVGTFDTGYKGMDTVHLHPVHGEDYQIRLPGYPAFLKKISGVREKGIKVELSEVSEEGFLFRVASNDNSNDGKNFLFAIMHRGALIFQKEFKMKGEDLPIRISSLALPAGINRFVLLDEQLVPLSERLFFSNNIDINRIQIEANEETYSTRSPVTLSLSESEDLGGMAWSSLSMSVVASNAINDQKKGSDIRSWLLLNSELRGTIESPPEFFMDDEEHSSLEKLDLLMLTQGWSNYLWNTTPVADQDTSIQPPAGISLSGVVKRPLSNRPVVDGKVVCNIFNIEGYYSIETTTDNQGRYLFRGLYIPDSASLFIKGYNSKGKLYTEVFLDPVVQPGPEVSAPYLPVSRRLEEFPVRLYQQQYFSLQELREYSLRTGSILLDEVTVKNRFTPVSDGHYRNYAKPRDSFKITEKDYHYLNVFDYLLAHVSGLSSGPISFTAGGSAQLLLLNGVEIERKDLESIPMSEVDVIEFIKHYDVTRVAMFGTRGANGVISVFTKKGGEIKPDNYVQGTLTRRINGFSSYREFYAPVYTPENIDSDLPDHRITLYWDPEIEMQDGAATVSFFTSDDYSRYNIIVEGITSTGEICMGEAEIMVARDHASLLPQ